MSSETVATAATMSILIMQLRRNTRKLIHSRIKKMRRDAVERRAAISMPLLRDYFFSFFDCSHLQIHSSALHFSHVDVSYFRRAVTAFALAFSLY